MKVKDLQQALANANPDAPVVISMGRFGDKLTEVLQITSVRNATYSPVREGNDHHVIAKQGDAVLLV